MNYYPFHIGDYAAHTAHLTPIEDIAYRRCLDAYYLREGALPHEPFEIARLIRMRDDLEAVKQVLNEFFSYGQDGWIHTRCEEEIERMQDKQAKARASAEASVNARRAKVEQKTNDGLTDAERTLNERSTDVELPTPTPTPIPTPVKKHKAQASKPADVSDAAWESFAVLRKAKRAPITELAISGIEREARKAGLTLEQALTVCCERGWAGFKAEWLEQHKGVRQASTEPAWRSEQRDRIAKHFPNIAAKPAQPDYIDAEVSHVAPIELG